MIRLALVLIVDYGEALKKHLADVFVDSLEGVFDGLTPNGFYGLPGEFVAGPGKVIPIFRS